MQINYVTIIFWWVWSGGSRLLAMAKQVFLSYGREQEVQAFVIRLKHDLETNGFTVWLDIEDIPAGMHN